MSSPIEGANFALRRSLLLLISLSRFLLFLLEQIKHTQSADLRRTNQVFAVALKKKPYFLLVLLGQPRQPVLWIRNIGDV